MNADRPICVMISALGGQGGGVLVDWLVRAARLAGYTAQATSIAGVAQRTGATTYYFEIFPEKSPPEDPVFSLFPNSGDVDLVAALEPMEAGRALTEGLITNRTTVVTTGQRIYSTAEKMLAGDSAQSARPVLDGIAANSKRMIEWDFAAAARDVNSQGNAVLFGTMAGTKVMPLSVEDCRRAIEESGVAVDRNLAGFDAGVDIARRDGQAKQDAAGLTFEDCPAELMAAVQALPEPIQALVGHGCARLVDYQDVGYARLYLDRLGDIVVVDKPQYQLSKTVAQRLAAWMCFEDVIRVAQLKTRPGRLARIRAEAGLAPDAPFFLQDFLKPGREEFAGLLPPALAKWLPGKNWGLPVRLPTTAAWGYALLKLLAGLRSWRPRSARYLEEHTVMDHWLVAVGSAAREDYDLACDTARLAVWARGYGDVRRRGLQRLNRLLTDWATIGQTDLNGVKAMVRASLRLAKEDPDAPLEAAAPAE